MRGGETKIFKRGVGQTGSKGRFLKKRRGGGLEPSTNHGMILPLSF